MGGREPERGTDFGAPDEGPEAKAAVAFRQLFDRQFAELYRFVESAGVLVVGQGEPGRGVYTCKRLSCFERAAATRAFNRTLRRTVQVDPELSALYNRA